MRYFPVRGRIFGCMVVLLGLIYWSNYNNHVSEAVAKENTQISLQDIYAEDGRLKAIGHETYAYSEEGNPVESYLYDQYIWVAQSYDEEEIAEFSHAYFDEQNRLLYVLGYSANILSGNSSYCEERTYEWDDAEHTCRYIYYKSNSMPYDSGYYIAFRYMFEVCEYQFDEDGRLLLRLSYRRNTGSDPYGYSDELFFDRGYQADYDGKRLMAELQYYDFWGTNEVGDWEYRVYQYDEQGNCILKVVTTGDEIMLYCYEYHEETEQIDEYTYEIIEDWELYCDDGSTYFFRPKWGESARVEKVAADGTVEKELFYGRAMDMGQQNYLMPEEVEDTVDDHTYIVRTGDCLWNIAHKYYGQGTYYELIYRMNRETIGRNENLILPGMRLYIPEAGNAQDTKVAE